MDETRWSAALPHRSRLLQLAAAKGMSQEDAADVVQEAMVRCVEFEALDVERIGQFLTSVTVRLCVDVHRRNAEPVRAIRWLAPLLDDEPDPADVICRDHGPEWVAALVGRLPERQREIMLDRARGMSIQQIASRRELTYKAVESALARARAALRAAVGASMALVTFVAARRNKGWARNAAVTVSAAAAFVVTVAVLVSPSPPPATRESQPFVSSVTRPATNRAAPPVSRPAGAPAMRPSPVPQLTPSPDSSTPPRRPSRPANPLPTFTVSQGPFKVERYDDGYTIPERLEQCLTYGLQTYPTVRCSYPPSGVSS